MKIIRQNVKKTNTSDDPDTMPYLGINLLYISLHLQAVNCARQIVPHFSIGLVKEDRDPEEQILFCFRSEIS